MYIFIAFFRSNANEKYILKETYFEHFIKTFPDYKDKLKKVKGCVAYFTGKVNSEKNAYSLLIKEYEIKNNEIVFIFHKAKQQGFKSKDISDSIHNLSKKNKWVNEKNMSPLVCFLSEKDYINIFETIKQSKKIELLVKDKDYKGVCMLYAPLGEVKNNKSVWNNSQILYPLGLSCSKLCVTLLIKAQEKKKLETARKYRQFCVEFLERGAQLEHDNARFAAALAYRYYSNVHELTRPGERRDSELEYEIEKANEWLSRALEIYPDSIRNNYRKGKLIIEKQAPHLLFGKKSFGKREAALIREIRQVGEEHLARAIALYEEQKEERKKEKDAREYTKALFVLGGHYLDDASLPIHEYCMYTIAGKENKTKIKTISKLNIESAIENLEKCYYAETNVPLAGKIDWSAFATDNKKWARPPVEKLYRLGCAYSARAFIELAADNEKKSKEFADKAIKFLRGAKQVSDSLKDRKRNTWHISEKIAWVYIFQKKYDMAAKLLERARAGYIINTYAIARMLCGSKENTAMAKAVLKKAAHSKNNLAVYLSLILYSYTLFKSGEKTAAICQNLSAKNKRIADILEVDYIKQA